MISKYRASNKKVASNKHTEYLKRNAKCAVNVRCCVSTNVRLGISIIHLLWCRSFRSRFAFCVVFICGHKRNGRWKIFLSVFPLDCALWMRAGDKSLCSEHYLFEQDVPSERDSFPLSWNLFEFWLVFFFCRFFSSALLFARQFTHTHTHTVVFALHMQINYGVGVDALGTRRALSPFIHLSCSIASFLQKLCTTRSVGRNGK